MIFIRCALTAVFLLTTSSCATERDIYTASAEAVVQLKNGEHGGTAFAIKAPSGRTVLVSNRHVCNKAASMTAESPSLSRPAKVTVLETSSTSDLCVLTAPAQLKPLRMAKEGPDLGDRIWVAGQPNLMGLTVTTGRIRALDKKFPVLDGTIEEKDCKKPFSFFGIIYLGCEVEVTANEGYAEIRPGSSGSPVLNSSGRVNGVAFAGGDGISLYVPFKELEEFLSVY